MAVSKQTCVIGVFSGCGLFSLDGTQGARRRSFTVRFAYGMSAFTFVSRGAWSSRGRSPEHNEATKMREFE